MVLTIGPMVHGASRKVAAAGVASSHVVGGALGGLVTGLCAAVAGYLSRRAVNGGAPIVGVSGVILVVLGVAIAHDALGGGRFGLARQTVRGWRYLLPDSWTAFLNGFDLGLGWTTRIYFASYVVVLIAAFMTASPAVGGLIGAMYGASRAGAVLVGLYVSHEDRASIERLLGWVRSVRTVNAAAIGIFAMISIALAATSELRPWIWTGGG